MSLGTLLKKKPPDYINYAKYWITSSYCSMFYCLSFAGYEISWLNNLRLYSLQQLDWSSNKLLHLSNYIPLSLCPQSRRNPSNPRLAWTENYLSKCKENLGHCIKKIIVLVTFLLSKHNTWWNLITSQNLKKNKSTKKII